MSNNFYGLSDSALSNQAETTSIAVAADEAGYGISAGDSTSLETRLTQFNTALDTFAIAETAFRAASEAKKTARGLLLSSLSKVANKVYAAELATNEMLAAAGLAVRDPRSVVTPQKVLAFLATPNADGTVKLAWQRNGNKYGVLFVIEFRPDATADWEQLTTTKRQSLTVSGFDPGVRADFRVIATNIGLSSTPSDIQTIYEDGGAAFMVAAA